MNYDSNNPLDDPLLETMFVNNTLDKIDQTEIKKEIKRLREENLVLKEQLGYKRISVQSDNYDDLVNENVKLKRKLGVSEDEISKCIKENNPYKKSNNVWIIYMIFNILYIIGLIIFMIYILNKY